MSAPREIGIEPLAVDLVFSGRPLTAAEHQELDDFFRLKHAEKARQRTLTTERQQLAIRGTASREGAETAERPGQ